MAETKDQKKTKDETKEEAPFMRTSFKITVTKTEMQSVLKGNKWVEGGSIGASGKYGYTPMISTLEETVVDIFSQTVEELNLEDVIKAVNGMK